MPVKCFFLDRHIYLYNLAFDHKQCLKFKCLNQQKRKATVKLKCTESRLPVVVTIFCTNTPAFCRQLTLKPPRLDLEESRSWAEPADTWRGVVGTDPDWTGLTLATGFSSVCVGGRLHRDAYCFFMTLPHVFFLSMVGIYFVSLKKEPQNENKSFLWNHSSFTDQFLWLKAGMLVRLWSLAG